MSLVGNSSDHVVQMDPLDHQGAPNPPSQLYSSLPLSATPRTIRVLDLNPPQTGQTRLTGTLRTVSLADSPRFTALSYAWGEQTSPSHTITIKTPTSGSVSWKLQLTANCHSALLHLNKRLGSVTIWVDAICINQGDDGDKSMQIPLMQEIYTWANPVYVWLGEGNTQSDKAMDYLFETSTYEREFDALEYLLFPNASLWTKVIGWIKYWRRLYIQDTLCAIRGWRRIIAWVTCNRICSPPKQWLRNNYDIECFKNLLNPDCRPWIQRAWTLQEILLAWNIVIVCGNKALPWDKFLRGMKYTTAFSMSIGDLPRCFHNWWLLLNLWFGCQRSSVWNSRQRRYPSSKVQKGLFPHKRRNWKWLTLVFNIYSVFASGLTIGLVSGASVYLGWSDYAHIVVYIAWFVVAFQLLFKLGYGRDETRIIKAESIGPPYTEPNQALNGIIQAFRDRTASDAKDKSYAMYGVLSGFGASLSPPDYGKPLGLIFKDLFTDLISWRVEFIRMLMDAGTGKEQILQNTPTWVPVFHDRTSQWLDPRYYNGTNPHSATSSRTLASVREIPNTPTPDGGLRVPIQWHAVSTLCSGRLRAIVGAENSDPSSRMLRERFSKFISWFYHLRMTVPPTRAYASISNAVYSVLQGRTRPKQHSTAFYQWYQIMLELTAETNISSECYNPEVIDHGVQTLTANPNATHYFNQCCELLAATRRNVFISSRGYIGSGPERMVDGDRVALVAGVPVPMILRDAEDGSSRYTVVGPAFVQGLMEGEDWAEESLQTVELI